MAKFILPTNDILRELEHLEHMFVFYEGGIRGVIKDTVLLSNAWELTHYSSAKHDGIRPITAHGLVDKIIRDYENSPNAIFLHYSENTRGSVHVELASELIDNAVSDMMSLIFKHLVYDVCKTQWEWIGNDLLTNISIYEQRKPYEDF